MEDTTTPATTPPTASPADIPQLLQAAEHATCVGDPHQAVALLTVALSTSTSTTVTTTQQHLDLLEQRAELYVSIQQPDAAARDYQSAIELHLRKNERGDATQQQLRLASLYMYCGQLSTGHDALENYQQGLQLLLQQQQQPPDTTTISNAVVPPLLAAAYTAIAEVYLTDLCMMEGAEAACHTALQQALHHDPDSIDALQTMASLQLSSTSRNGQDDTVTTLPAAVQQQHAAPSTAEQLMRKVYASMQEGCVALSTLVGLDGSAETDTDATELLELDAVQALPGFEFRCTTAKLLLECNSTSTGGGGLAAAAVHVVGSLLAENDQVVEIWVLAGDAFALLLLQQEEPQEQTAEPKSSSSSSSPHAETAIHYWERAEEMLQTIRENLMEMDTDEAGGGGDDDDEDTMDEDERQQQLDEVEVQLEELRTKLQEMRTQV